MALKRKNLTTNVRIGHRPSAFRVAIKALATWARIHVLKHFIPIGREISYVIYYKRNVEQLKAGIERLLVTRAYVQKTVDGRQDKAVSFHVQKWLEEAGVTEKISNDLLNEAKANMKKLLNGWCPNPTARYSLSKKTVKELDRVIELQEDILDRIADPAPPPRIGSITLNALSRRN